MITRRRLLETSMLAGVALLVPGIARAFMVETAPVKVQELQQLACAEQQTHRDLVAEALAKIDDKTLPEDDRQKVMQAFDCPYCGCRLDPKYPPVG